MFEDDAELTILTASTADREWIDPLRVRQTMILKGLGAVFVSTSTLFKIWSLLHDHPEAASAQLAQLHSADAWPFSPGKQSAELSFEEGEADDVPESRGFATPDWSWH